MFYFEDLAEMDHVMQKAPRSFNNDHLVIQCLIHGMSPSNLTFDTTPILMQVHDLQMDWHKEAIVRGVVSFVGFVTEIVGFFSYY